MGEIGEKTWFLMVSYVKTGKKEGKQLGEGGTAPCIHRDEQRKGHYKGQKQSCIPASSSFQNSTQLGPPIRKKALSGLTSLKCLLPAACATLDAEHPPGWTTLPGQKYTTPLPPREKLPLKLSSSFIAHFI